MQLSSCGIGSRRIMHHAGDILQYTQRIGDAMSIKGKPVSAVTATVLVACSLLIPSVANASQESLDRGDFSIACHQQHGWSWFPQQTSAFSATVGRHTVPMPSSATPPILTAGTAHSAVPLPRPCIIIDMSSNKNHTKVNWQTITITVLAIALAVNSFLLYAFYWSVDHFLTNQVEINASSVRRDTELKKRIDALEKR